MKRLLLKLSVFVLVAGFFQQPLMAEDSAPELLIKKTADEVLEIIKARAQEFQQDPAKLYAMVDEKVLLHFDFDRMTDLALGRNKAKVSKQQKPQLVNEFRQLLVRTYGKALLEYNDQEIKYLPMRGSLEKGDVSIRTEIEQKGGFPIPLNYEVFQKEGTWKVYDISVDGISLVSNYRSTFTRKIKEDGVDGLIKSLQDRNKQENS